METSYESLAASPETVPRVVQRRVRFHVQYAGRYYPAVSLAHVAEIMDSPGVECEGNLLWSLHRHTHGRSGVTRNLLAEYATLHLHQTSGKKSPLK